MPKKSSLRDVLGMIVQGVGSRPPKFLTIDKSGAIYCKDEEGLQDLYIANKKNPIWGNTIWVINTLKRKPLQKLQNKLKDLHLWDQQWEDFA